MVKTADTTDSLIASIQLNYPKQKFISIKRRVKTPKMLISYQRYRRRIVNDRLLLVLTLTSATSMLLWFRCSLTSPPSAATAPSKGSAVKPASSDNINMKPEEKKDDDSSLNSPTEISKAYVGFCAKCRESASIDAEMAPATCEIIEYANPSRWTFAPDEATKSAAPAWFMKWNDYRGYFPLVKVDAYSKKLTWVKTDAWSYGAFYRYLANPGLLATILKNHTTAWRTDLSASIFKSLAKFDVPVEVGDLAEQWHNGAKDRFVAQNWYRFLEGEVREEQWIERGTEKKLAKQWKQLIEFTESSSFAQELAESSLKTDFLYSVQFSRSLPGLRSFLQRYDKFVKGKRVLIFGSNYPWLEYEIFLREPELVTTASNFDLKQILPENHPRLKFVNPSKLDRLAEDYSKLYDLVISFSQLEHVGLGRYGDPLNPDGDLMLMTKLSCLVKPGGLALLSIPVDGDCLEYNYQRFYGPVRYSLLTECWRVVEYESFETSDCSTRDWTYQPWFVLQNLRGCLIEP